MRLSPIAAIIESATRHALLELRTDGPHVFATLGYRLKNGREGRYKFALSVIDLLAADDIADVIKPRVSIANDDIALAIQGVTEGLCWG